MFAIAALGLVVVDSSGFECSSDVVSVCEEQHCLEDGWGSFIDSMGIPASVPKRVKIRMGGTSGAHSSRGVVLKESKTLSLVCWRKSCAVGLYSILTPSAQGFSGGCRCYIRSFTYMNFSLFRCSKLIH